MQVTIVGNAPVVKSVGHIIDQSPLVCRFNTFNLYGCEDKIGSRTTDWIVRRDRTHQVYLFDTSQIRMIYAMWSEDEDNEHLEGRGLPIKHALWMTRNATMRIQSLYPDRNQKIIPTLGIAAIWFYLKLFDKVQIAGFGPPHDAYHGRMEDAPHMWKYRRIGGEGHFWNFERRLINGMVDNGKVIRLEDGVFDT